MSDIKNQLIKDSYNYVLQSDINTGVVYRIGGDVPVNPTFLSGLTINSGFTFQNGTESEGYVLTSDANGNARWAGVSGASVASVTASTGLSGNSTTGAITLVNTAPDKTVVITGGTGIQIISSYPNFGINFTGQTSFPYLPLSGGTVTGNVILQSGLTANTISATTYYGINAVTGGTYSNGRITLGGSGNINTIISGLPQGSITAVTESNNTVTVASNGSSNTFVIDAVTGGTYSNGIITLGGSGNINTTISGLSSLTPTTLYSGDGTISGNRIVSLSSRTLTFSSSTASNLLVLSGSSIGVNNSNPTGGTLDLRGTFNFPTTTGSTYGVIRQNGDRLLHTYGTSNLFLGKNSGNFTSSGDGLNIGIGSDTLSANTTGVVNIAIGNSSLLSQTIGGYNVAIGLNSMMNNLTSIGNTAIGHSSLPNGGAGFNVAIGNSSLYNNLYGANNVAIGLDSLSTNIGGGGNVAIGYRSGYYETGSNKLHIANNENSTLIYGEFDNNFVGINTTSSTNALTVSGVTDPLKLINVQTGADAEYLTIDSNGVVHKSSPTKKLVLKTIELGSKIVQNKSVDNISLPNFLKNVFNYETQLTNITITGLKYDFYYTINDDSKRVKILYATKYRNEITGTFFSDMNDFIYDLYDVTTVNFYVESYIDVNYSYNSPTEMKLVNPLFNSLRPSKYSRGGNNYRGRNQYVRNILSPQNDENAPFAHSNNIRSEFYLGWANYYDYNTSNDIPRKIYDIVNATPGLYGNGDLRTSSISALFNGYDNDVRESLNNATYVESNKNVYSKFRVPVNQYGFLQSMRNRNHNFYGTLLYDLVGGSDGNKTIYSSNTNVKSQAFLQLVDTYRIYSEGNPGTIFANTDFEQDTHLNDLQYKVGIPKNLKYISPSVKLDGGYGTKRDRSYIQVLPGYSETYLLKINVTGNPGDYSVNVDFINSLLQDYLVTNDPSNTKNHNYWVNFTTGQKDYYPVTTILDNSTNFVEPSVNPYGSYIIIQSNDEKMYTLSQNPIYTSAGGEISVEAIYKGHSFTPLLYPLNFSQLLLEVPESFYYDSVADNIIPSKNSENNTTVLSGNQVTDKKLRLIVKYKNLNKYDLIEVPLKCTSTRSSLDNTIFELTIEDEGRQSIEHSIIKSLKKNKLNNFKPGNVEIYFAFLKINASDANLNETSIIPNYKMIITKYGDNEVFKLIRESSDNNIVFP